jgi:hypothetical protein
MNPRCPECRLFMRTHVSQDQKHFAYTCTKHGLVRVKRYWLTPEQRDNTIRGLVVLASMAAAVAFVSLFGPSVP